jgi:hypothetical protein
MRVTYTPAGGDATLYDFDPDAVRASAAELIEKRYGDTYDKWRAAIVQGSIKARRVLLWHLTTLTHHTLRYEDTPDFAAGELVVELSKAELLALRAKVEKSNLESRDELLSALDMEIAQRDADEAETLPKAE